MENCVDVYTSDTEETSEMKTNNLSEKVVGSSGCLFEAVCPGYDVETTMSLTFSFDSLNDKPRTENILVGKHLNWYLYAKKKTYKGEDNISLFAYTEDWNKYPMTYDVEYALEAKNSEDRIVRTCRPLICDEPTKYYDLFGVAIIFFNKFLTERDKFETDGKVTVTAKIHVRMPMCYNFNDVEPISDVTIKIGTQSFPFNKASLAFHSDFFRAMFFGQFDESKKDEVSLVDVDIVAFVKLINVVFIRSFELKLKSVPSVLELADRFGMLSVVDHCENLLVKCDLNSEPSLAERLVLATKHPLNRLQRCTVSLVHACQCRDANCRRMSCHKLKRVVQHTRMCKKRVNASCPVCKQLIALCCYHAKHCNRDSGTVPFCMNIRQKRAEQKRSIARRADMMMRRRMEGLQAGAGGAIASASASSQAGSSSGSSSQGHSGGGMSAGGAKDGNANAPNKMMNSSQMPQMQQMQNANRTASEGGFVQHSGMPNQQGQGGMGQPNSQQTPQQLHMFNAGGAMSGMQGMNSMMQQQQVQHLAQQPVRQNSTNSLQQQQVQQGQRPPQQQQQQQSAAGAPPANMNPPPYRPPGAGGPMQNMGGVYGAMMQQQSHGNMQQMQHQQQQQMRMPGPTQPGRQQMPPGMGQPMPQVPGGQRPMNVQDQAMQVQVQRIQERLQNSNQDERAIVFQELKKTPHLFAAFIKTQPQPNMDGQRMPGVPGGANWGGMPAGNPHQAMYGGQNPGMQQGGRPMQPGGQYQMGWQQQKQFQQGRPQGSPAVGGAGQYGNAQAPGRSPMGMGQSPMMQPGQGMMQQQPQAQTDQGGQYR